MAMCRAQDRGDRALSELKPLITLRYILTEGNLASEYA